MAQINTNLDFLDVSQCKNLAAPVDPNDAARLVDVSNSAPPPASDTAPGIIEIADQAEVDTGTATDLVVTPETLANWGNRKYLYIDLIGDGAATSIIVNHNFGHTDYIVQVFKDDGSGDVICNVQRDSVNCTLTFNVAPAAQELRVVVLG